MKALFFVCPELDRLGEFPINYLLPKLNDSS